MSRIYRLYTLSGSDVPYRASSHASGRARDVSFPANWSDGRGRGVIAPLPAFQEIQDQAERMRVKAQAIYGGSWIVEYHVGEEGRYRDPYPEPPMGSVRTREQARREAERAILAGPDTAGKRFLLGRCNGPLADALPIKPVFDPPSPLDDELPF